jgi:hypothetical protein
MIKTNWIYVIVDTGTGMTVYILAAILLLEEVRVQGENH